MDKDIFIVSGGAVTFSIPERDVSRQQWVSNEWAGKTVDCVEFLESSFRLRFTDGSSMNVGMALRYYRALQILTDDKYYEKFYDRKVDLYGSL